MEKDPVGKKRRSWDVGYWLLALVAMLVLQSLWESTRQVELLPYSEFERYLADGRVAEVIVTERGLTGKLKSPDGKKTAIAAARVEPELAARLDKYGVPYR
ncbi:MAG: ATP-dependent metallopeptidase FtsH/Yme1/Tma family protein, partial [Rhizobacter sp.]